ncbi:D-aminoacylase [Caproiciproducens sp. NJN-50]|uniref:N-acyl-D-amino-acid deacylase family protein n=1 Tax=Caproiciproducens sp. NJN-50 TaxID=2507162 RepID=UPI000FFE0E42|nr:D-aminoacylase [Caproiciproducens sp. NJN-50]QAT48873.1 D-aminoacylase [Caproiciproducens sp. NJN-50]
MGLLVRGGMIVDGSGGPPFKGDLLIREDKVAEIGRRIDRENVPVLDAENKVVCPGFIDTHSHSDLRVLTEPDLPPKISQGITTEIYGQDGVSLAPLPKPYRSGWSKNISGLLGDLNSAWRGESVPDYFEAVRRAGPVNNILYLVPHGNIRMQAMGLEGRAAEAGEIGRMKDLLSENLDAGCPGMSTGLIYPPCAFAETGELEALCVVLAEKGKPLVVHQRSEAGRILESMQELIWIARRTGVKVHISHFKLAGKNNWHLLDHLLETLEGARREGLDFSFDLYPYTAGSTMFSAILPPWALSGGTERMLERLKNARTREKIRDCILHPDGSWDNFIEFAGVENIYITDAARHPEAVGKNLVQIGGLYGCDPMEASFRLLAEEENRVGMVDYYGNEETLVRMMQSEGQNFCTDGLLGGTPHPRVYGSFPRVIARYVREKKVMSLEQAVHKMAEVPARRFGIEGRGSIRKGCFADLVVFDPLTIRDTATYLEPRSLSEGIEAVLVNGRICYLAGRGVLGRGGRVLHG